MMNYIMNDKVAKRMACAVIGIFVLIAALSATRLVLMAQASSPTDILAAANTPTYFNDTFQGRSYIVGEKGSLEKKYGALMVMPGQSGKKMYSEFDVYVFVNQPADYEVYLYNNLVAKGKTNFIATIHLKPEYNDATVLVKIWNATNKTLPDMEFSSMRILGASETVESSEEADYIEKHETPATRTISMIQGVLLITACILGTGLALRSKYEYMKIGFPAKGIRKVLDGQGLY